MCSMHLELRPARPGEEEALLALYAWLFAPPGTEPPTWDPRRASIALRQAIESPDACVLLASTSHRMVGICTAYLDIRSVRYGQRCWVEDLAVDPAYRSQGIGKSLLDAAKVWARERGATHLELDSGDARRDAHRFYERERPSWRSVCFAWQL